MLSLCRELAQSRSSFQLRVRGPPSLGAFQRSQWTCVICRMPYPECDGPVLSQLDTSGRFAENPWIQWSRLDGATVLPSNLNINPANKCLEDLSSLRTKLVTSILFHVCGCSFCICKVDKGEPIQSWFSMDNSVGYCGSQRRSKIGWLYTYISWVYIYRMFEACALGSWKCEHVALAVGKRAWFGLCVQQCGLLEFGCRGSYEISLNHWVNWCV